MFSRPHGANLFLAGLILACSSPTSDQASTAKSSNPTAVTAPSQDKNPVKVRAQPSDSNLTAGRSSPDDGPFMPPQELYPPTEFISPLTQRVHTHLQRLSRLDLSLHDDRFIKVGGSGSSSPLLLSCLETSAIAWGDWSHLDSTVRRFKKTLDFGSSVFKRKSLAAKPGATASWAISGSPSPLDLEIAALQPRFALVHYGTNDMHQKGTFLSSAVSFNRDMRRLLRSLQAKGIIPIVTSVMPRDDNLVANGWVPLFNHSLRALAQYDGIPYLDLHSAILSLPNRGRAEDKLHGNVMRQDGVARPCDFREEALQFSYNVRNLLSVRILDKLSALIRGEIRPFEEANRLQGHGSKRSPWKIPTLPFAHRVNTATSHRMNRSNYPGCSNTYDFSGPELEYRISVTEPTRIRAFLLSDASVKVDIFLLEEGGSTENCLAQGTRALTRLLIPGTTYRFIVDTRMEESNPQWGEATFIVHPCGRNDPLCD